MKKRKVIIIVLLVFVLLVSGLFFAFFVNNAKKQEMLKEPIQYREYTIYPSCYEEGNEMYVTFSVKDKNGYDIIPKENKWLLREFYEIGFAPQDVDSPPSVYVITRDKETLFGKTMTLFEITELSKLTKQDKGYVNISDNEFLKNAKEVEVSATPEDLIKIYGVEPFYSSLSVICYFNDNYYLRVIKDTSITVYKRNTKQIVYQKQADDIID